MYALLVTRAIICRVFHEVKCEKGCRNKKTSTFQSRAGDIYSNPGTLGLPVTADPPPGSGLGLVLPESDGLAPFWPA